MKRTLPATVALALTLTACTPELLQSVISQLKRGDSLKEIVQDTVETYTGEEVTFTEEEKQTFSELPEPLAGDLSGNWYMFGDTHNLMQLTQSGSAVTGTVTNRDGHKGTVTGTNNNGHVHLKVIWETPLPAGQSFSVTHAEPHGPVQPVARRLGRIAPPRPGRAFQGPPPKIEMQLIFHGTCLVGRQAEFHPGGRTNHLPVFFLLEKDGQVQACERLGLFPHVPPESAPSAVPSAAPSAEPSAEASAEPSAEPTPEASDSVEAL